MIIEINISELRIGHFVVDIVKQRGSFNLTHPGHIKSEKIIQNLLRKGVKTLLIDTSKTLTKTTEIIKEKSATQKYTDDNNRPVILSVTKALKLFNEAKNIQKNVFEDALLGKELNLTPVIEVTNKTIETIFKNPDALACVINIRKKHEYLLEHSVSVSVLMTIFARFLNIDKQIIQLLSVGAFLHDIGKIMVPDTILNKPGKLTDNEFEIMKSHANHSIDIIKRTPDIAELSLEVVALHHEKLDGTGYPLQIKGENITQYGRMITICDIFDALTANRCYKDGYSHVKSFNILRKLAQQNQLDTSLVDQFIKCMGVYPVGSLVELNSNKIAIVERKNQGNPTKPKVRTFYDAQKNHYEMAKNIDLSAEDDFIVKGVRADDFDLDMNKIIEFLLMEG
ncbi:MAG: HD-GYP domain-containing protein (c-di-GMP phosphodiesterase class II) [Alteromonadaceae bacterium]|jgi:HD-GYP domain-containing protein (c-di-GMP phosphodiesterase class II)